MTDEELKQLIELAEQSTKGPWKYDWGNWQVESYPDRFAICNPCVRDCSFAQEKLKANLVDSDIANGLYIAACDPETIIKLTKELLELRSIVKDRWYVSSLQDCKKKIERYEDALKIIKYSVKSCRAGDGDERTWEQCSIDCEEMAEKILEE